MPKIKNINDLVEALAEEREALKKDPRLLNQTIALTDNAGKILAAAKLKMEYANQSGGVLEDDFFGCQRVPGQQTVKALNAPK